MADHCQLIGKTKKVIIIKIKKKRIKQKKQHITQEKKKLPVVKIILASEYSSFSIVGMLRKVQVGHPEAIRDTTALTYTLKCI